MRDNFSQGTVTEIGKAVGYRCSNPDCRHPTVAANAKQDGIVTLGVAAHICAASPGGPRYNAAQTRAERRGKENGLWLCQNCGRIVDADPASYPVEKMKEWKRTAQEKAFQEVVAPSQPAPSAEAMRIGLLVASDNREGVDASFDEAFEKFLAAASEDLGGHTRGPLWKRQQVELTLKILDQGDVPPFSISKLPPALEVAPEITVVAALGTGKTITVLQLTRFALAEGTIVPLYFRLGDVSESDGGLFGAWRRRPAFQGISDADFVRLAERGRILLVLDGWNELEPSARRQIRLSLEQALLARLARAHKNISGEFEWMRAILRRDTPAAVLLFVDLLCEGIFGQSPNGVDAWHVGRDLAQYVAKFPELKPKLEMRLDAAPPGSKARAALEDLFSEIASESDVLAMIDRYASEGRSYDQQMASAVYAVTIDQVPIPESSNTYNLHPRSVKDIRHALFARLMAKLPQAALAKRCLKSIDKLRDEHGIAANDPRHPDVLSGKPWPEEALL